VANRLNAVSQNVPGTFFVDTTCIDCDACRQLAPTVFGDTGEYSFVASQPSSLEENRAALRALLTCPTGSIGSSDTGMLGEVRHDFPLPLAEDVYFCGFNSAKSYGGNSYLVRHPAGNWLVDSPRYLESLARRLDALGGISHIFLTHRDDVADAAKYARRFGAQRIIHRRELAAQPDAEIVLDGFSDQTLNDNFVAIPTPGHTAGHCALLYQQKFLFTGDHLWWDNSKHRLGASRDYCWWSWPEQVRSLARLRALNFSWILPGHGERYTCSADEMQKHLDQLLARLGAEDLSPTS
jgi:glyoxylase-like metal-dependent hydrolase (beta-lactamase superfamily II)/ferredoxin